MAAKKPTKPQVKSPSQKKTTMVVPRESVRIEYMPLDEVQGWPRNPKEHNTEAIKASVQRFGFIQPIVLDEQRKRLVAGHGRLETLQAMHAAGEQPPARVEVRNGKWCVPVLRGVQFATEEEAEAFLLADNRLVETGGWNEQLLAESMQALQGAGIDVASLGWTDAELEMLIGNVAVETPSAVELPNIPSTRAIADKKENYENSTIRQAILYFDRVQYEEFGELADSMRKKHGVDNNAALVLRLLREANAAS